MQIIIEIIMQIICSENCTLWLKVPLTCPTWGSQQPQRCLSSTDQAQDPITCTMCVLIKSVLQLGLAAKSIESFKRPFCFEFSMFDWKLMALILLSKKQKATATGIHRCRRTGVQTNWLHSFFLCLVPISIEIKLNHYYNIYVPKMESL
jgi:hypothetical protein